MFGSTRVTNPKLTIIFYFLFLSRELVYPGWIFGTEFSTFCGGYPNIK